MDADTYDSDNQEFTCEICIVPASKRFTNTDKCSHPFCTECMISYIRVKLYDDNVSNIRCPASNCDHTLDPFACASVIGPELFVRWMDVLCEEAIVGREKCYCPYRNCNVPIVNEGSGDPKKSKCPKCKRWFCFQCKSVWHAGFRCEESDQYRDRNDVAFGILVETKKWRRCPRCKHFVERREGCPLIKCRCGIFFCYRCGDTRQHCSCYGTSQRNVDDCRGVMALIKTMDADTNDSDNQEFTCEICIEPTSKRFRNTDKCSYPFCNECMISYIRVKLYDDNIGNIRCPASNCDHMLDPFACASVIGPKLFVRWMDVLCEEAIVGREKCYCPYRNCNVPIVNECGEDPKKSKCPICKRWFCFHCKSAWHAGFRCEESNQFRDRDDVAFGILVETNKWRRCPQCKHFVERTEGCTNIKCRCGILFCYKCGDKKEHFLCSCYATSRDQIICDYICLGLIALGVLIFICWFLSTSFT